MKKTIITIFFFAILIVAGEGFINNSNAQVAQVRNRVENRIDRRFDRRVERRVERRVHRRVSRRAHLRYAGLPAFRSTVAVLPSGAVHVKVAGTRYYFHNGIYYSAFNNAYVVVRPRAGVRVSVLPARAIRITVRNVHYRYYYGTFYIEKGKEFEVVEAPEGAVVDALPEGYSIVDIDGTEYYSLDDVTYREVDAEEFEDGVGYEVVKL